MSVSISSLGSDKKRVAFCLWGFVVSCGNLLLHSKHQPINGGRLLVHWIFYEWYFIARFVVCNFDEAVFPLLEVFKAS